MIKQFRDPVLVIVAHPDDIEAHCAGTVARLVAQGRAVAYVLATSGNRGTHDPRVLITDKLASSGAAQRAVLPSVEHRRHKGLNNRAENSHQPTRERERRMRRFKSPGHAQRFLAAYGPIASHFRPRRHRLTAHDDRQARTERFRTWHRVTGTPVAA